MSLVRKPQGGPGYTGVRVLGLSSNTTLHKVGSRLNTQRWSHSHRGLVGHAREAIKRFQDKVTGQGNSSV